VASHFKKLEVLSTVLNAPAIVLQFLILEIVPSIYRKKMKFGNIWKHHRY